MDSIDQLMVEEHRKIKLILEEFEREVNINIPKAKGLFNKFKWNLEKHFFVEEKAIFGIMDKVKDREISDIFDLMAEHGSILELVKNIEDGLEKGVMPNVVGLKLILIRHANFEDATLYPELDRDLSEEYKREIVERIREVIRG